MSEKYVNYYVEIMTGTMQDAVLRNISLQAQAKVTEELLNENLNKINDLEQKIQDFNNESELLRQASHELATTKGEYESIKHQIQHLDTFRNELNREIDIQYHKLVHQIH